MALTRNLQCGDGTRDPFFAAIYLRRGLSGTTGSVQREDVGVEYGGSDEAAAVEAVEQPDQSELRRIESIVREAEERVRRAAVTAEQVSRERERVDIVDEPLAVALAEVAAHGHAAEFEPFRPEFALGARLRAEYGARLPPSTAPEVRDRVLDAVVQQRLRDATPIDYERYLAGWYRDVDARELAFDDPLTGQRRHFESRRVLSAVTASSS